MNERELQNPENWDLAGAVAFEPVKSPRSVVSVSFGHDDLAAVTQAARERGMKTSEFIRTAAVTEAARKTRKHVDVLSSGSTQGVMTVLRANWRRGGRGRVIVRSVSKSQSTSEVVVKP